MGGRTDARTHGRSDELADTRTKGRTVGNTEGGVHFTHGMESRTRWVARGAAVAILEGSVMSVPSYESVKHAYTHAYPHACAHVKNAIPMRNLWTRLYILGP